MTSDAGGGRGGSGQEDRAREVAWIYSMNILLNLDEGEGRWSKNSKIVRTSYEYLPLDKMKTLRGGRPLPGPVFEAKAQWMEAIQNVQAKRKDEIMNAATAEAAATGGTFAKPVPPPPAMLLHENHHHKSLAACNGVNGISGFEDKGEQRSFICRICFLV